MAESTDSSSKIFGQKWAVCLGGALLLGYAVITAFAVYDKSRRPDLEKALTLSAVGDKAYFPVPQTFDPSTPLVNFEGHSLYFVDWKYMLDSLMMRAGMDDANSFSVYQYTGRTQEDQKPFFYLKIKPGYYVQTKRE